MAYSNTTGLPSSTQVIKPWIRTEFITDEDLERGTAVHEAMTAHALGLWSPPLRRDWQPYFDSGRRWFDAVVAEVVLVEERLVDNERDYCGQPDLIAVLKGDEAWDKEMHSRKTLVDYKTAQVPSKWWPLQVASYRRLAEVDKGIVCGRGINVRLMKDGSAAKVDEWKDYAYHINVFIGMVNAWNYFE